MQVQPCLFFDGRCEEAVEFYRSALGAEVTMLMRFKDNPDTHEPGMADLRVCSGVDLRQLWLEASSPAGELGVSLPLGSHYV